MAIERPTVILFDRWHQLSRRRKDDLPIDQHEAKRRHRQRVGEGQAGDEGQLYGSVSIGDVIEGIKRFTGIELERGQVDLEEPIKAIGLHEVHVKVHEEVEFPLTLDVIPA